MSDPVSKIEESANSRRRGVQILTIVAGSGASMAVMTETNVELARRGFEAALRAVSMGFASSLTRTSSGMAATPRRPARGSTASKRSSSCPMRGVVGACPTCCCSAGGARAQLGGGGDTTGSRDGWWTLLLQHPSRRPTGRRERAFADDADAWLPRPSTARPDLNTNEATAIRDRLQTPGEAVCNAALQPLGFRSPKFSYEPAKRTSVARVSSRADTRTPTGRQ